MCSLYYRNEVYTDKEIGQISLIITNTQAEYGGEYTCEGTFTGNIQLKVSHTLVVQSKFLVPSWLLYNSFML